MWRAMPVTLSPQGHSFFVMTAERQEVSLAGASNFIRREYRRRLAGAMTGEG